MLEARCASGWGGDSDRKPEESRPRTRHREAEPPRTVLRDLFRKPLLVTDLIQRFLCVLVSLRPVRGQSDQYNWFNGIFRSPEGGPFPHGAAVHLAVRSADGARRHARAAHACG